MDKETIKRLLTPSGPLLSLALIGLMLLSGLLYARAIRSQRFLEPTLAITQPVIAFDQNIRSLLLRELGEDHNRDVRFTMNSLYVRDSVFLGAQRSADEAETAGRIGSVFKSILGDPDMRSRINVILVSTRFQQSTDPATNIINRHQSQDRADEVLNALYAADPELERNYAIYFEPTAMPVYGSRIETGVIVFRLIPSVRLHIDVLQKLEKYVQ